jgi:non-specific serine/threonine protein kinase
MSMPELQLSPTGYLHWRADDVSDAGDSTIAEIARHFDADWRAGLFWLAAQRPQLAAWASLRYWQAFAEHHLTALCHVPPEAVEVALPLPAAAELDRWVLAAPPQRGGEYLSRGMLAGIWEALTAWVQQTARADGGVHALIARRAPKWRQIGRVWLHLAENKSDMERPFAFMASYTSGLSEAGRVRHLPLGKALEHYAGADNRAALLRLLTPLQLAAKSVDWLRDLVDSGAIYQPLAWDPARAYPLLSSIPQLQECGLSVRVPDWWQARPRPKVSVSIERRSAGLGLAAMLDFNVGMALGDATLSDADIRELLRGDDRLVQFKGRWVEVDRVRLQQALTHWREVERHAADGIGFIEGMRLLAGASADLREDAADSAERHWLQIEAGTALRHTLDALRDPARLQAVEAGAGLQATLRPYQRLGLGWLHFLGGLGLGACLADDMGLGKTIQVLALLLILRDGGERAAPSLLVVPSSLLGNWRAEAQRFAPSLRLCFLHPSETDADTLAQIAADPAASLAGSDLVVTSYSMLQRQPWLGGIRWRLLILDEAQAIKNAGTRQSKAVRALPANARIALTGTPVENHLGDLWSLFDFLNPGLLGTASAFKSFVKRLAAREPQSYAPLRQLVAPYILRRMKTDRSIIADLPAKTETPCYCSLTPTQVRLYQRTVEAMADALVGAEGIIRRGLVLQTLLRLKQICNHPGQLSAAADFAAADSGKFLRLAELCEELALRQERVLVFTQFREIIDPLMRHLAAVFGRPGLCLHGGTAVAARKDIVAGFQADDGPPFLVLSLKAGGTGLNLTAASQVIHFDRWWNPAVENQATDRAFRIGQTRPVLVHKFVTRGTVEERIDAMIAEKQKLADEILTGGAEINLTELDDQRLLELVRLDLDRAQLQD